MSNLNLCAGTLHQVFNCCVGEGGWFGNSRPGGSSACMPRARDPPSEATPAFGIVDRENDGNTVHNL